MCVWLFVVFYYVNLIVFCCKILELVCRSTTAETEVFTRACAAIEARLEHKVRNMKY